MFSGFRDALLGRWLGSAASATASASDPLRAPSFAKPWEDTTLSAQERYDSYKAVVREQCQRIYDAGTRPGVTQEERYAMSQDPENRMWKAEFEQIRKETPEEFCYRIDGGAQRELLGKNFLGAKEWGRGFGVDVGAEPPFPKAITKELLEQECPLNPGKLVKDTHILVLIPKTVDGEPYTPLKLGKMCASRKRSGAKLIRDDNDRANAWKRQDWARTPQAQSEWVLIPKSDPDPRQVPTDKHFRNKTTEAQEKVHQKHYPEYREVKALEVMTMALLNELVSGGPRILDGGNYLRCIEPSASSGRVCVGGLRAEVYVGVDGGDLCNYHIGRGIALKFAVR